MVEQEDTVDEDGRVEDEVCLEGKGQRRVVDLDGLLDLGDALGRVLVVFPEEEPVSLDPGEVAGWHEDGLDLEKDSYTCPAG